MEQLDAHVGERSRADVDKKTLRPIGDLFGHRNKKERTINKAGQLPEITKRVETAWSHRMSPRGLLLQPARLAVGQGTFPDLRALPATQPT